jgi:hypothetical protein
VSDEKVKPTHVMQVVFDNGVSIPVSWCEQTRPVTAHDMQQFYDGIPVDSVQVEGFFETSDYLMVRKADGTVARFTKAKVIYYSISPWKDLPESMKERLEKAKASQSPHGAH